MSIYFADQRWPQLRQAVEENTLIILPVGQMEQHGKHLPVSTDTAIAESVARRLAEALVTDNVPTLVMPAIWAGYSSKELARFPGTMRVRHQVLIDLLCDICGSLVEMGFRKIMLLTTHGHHNGPLRIVTRRIADAHSIYMALVSPATLAAERYNDIRKSARGGSIHGGEYETALMLYLGEPADMAQATAEDIMLYHSDFVAGDNFVAGQKVFWSTWGLQETKTGIYGDPSVATAETGREIMEAIVANGVAFAKEFWFA